MQNVIKFIEFFYLTVVMTFGMTGCRSVHRVEHSNYHALQREEKIVFARPQKYSTFGTRSLRDFIEITYENSGKNSAGLPKIDIGVRYRGEQNWYAFWERSPRRIEFFAASNFYASARGGRHNSRPVYSSCQKVVLEIGRTANFSFICPVAEADRYQIVFSEVK